MHAHPWPSRQQPPPSDAMRARTSRITTIRTMELTFQTLALGYKTPSLFIPRLNLIRDFPFHRCCHQEPSEEGVGEEEEKRRRRGLLRGGAPRSCRAATKDERDVHHKEHHLYASADYVKPPLWLHRPRLPRRWRRASLSLRRSFTAAPRHNVIFSLVRLIFF